MSDVAVLGLAVDSSQVKQATTDLNNFAAAAKPAAAGASNLAQAADAHSESLRGQRQVLRGLAGDLALLGPEFGHTAEMAALLYVENAHLFEGFGGLKNALGALITPTNLMIGGLAGLAAGSVLALVSWKNFAFALDDVARQAGVATSQMAQLQAAASFHDIGTADFTKGIGAFSEQVFQAKSNMGSLVETLRANGVSAAGDFTTVFGKAADLIKRASGDTERQFALLREMGLPATMEWVRFLSQGSDGIKHATEEAVKFGGAANDEMVAKAREFNEAWNRSWTNFSYAAKQNTVVAATGLQGLIDKAKQGLLNLGNNYADAVGGRRFSTSGPVDTKTDNTPITLLSIASRVGNTLPKDANAPKTAAERAKEIADAQPRLGLLGTLPVAAQQTAPKPEPAKEAA